MEAFEQFVALALESEGLAVNGAVKFPVVVHVKKKSRTENQVHGFEVDLIGARNDRLVLATVKSYFGSRGVVASDVNGLVPSRTSKRYAVLNNATVRKTVTEAAAKRFGYSMEQLELRLYVGRFALGNEAAVREWCAGQIVGGGPIRVVDAHEVVAAVRQLAISKQYRDSAVLATMKVLAATGNLLPEPGAGASVAP